jgi:hypothetical protein
MNLGMFKMEHTFLSRKSMMAWQRDATAGESQCYVVRFAKVNEFIGQNAKESLNESFWP